MGGKTLLDDSQMDPFGRFPGILEKSGLAPRYLGFRVKMASWAVFRTFWKSAWKWTETGLGVAPKVSGVFSGCLGCQKVLGWVPCGHSMVVCQADIEN